MSPIFSLLKSDGSHFRFREKWRHAWLFGAEYIYTPAECDEACGCELKYILELDSFRYAVWYKPENDAGPHYVQPVEVTEFMADDELGGNRIPLIGFRTITYDELANENEMTTAA